MRLITYPQRPCQYTPEQLDRTTVIFGSGSCLDRGLEAHLGTGYCNLSLPGAAINLHLRNLELLAEQGLRPARIVWVTAEPTAIAVLDREDRVVRWGTAVADRWHAQGQTPDWDLGLRLRLWQRAAQSFGSPQLWLTESARTHTLTGWPLIEDPDSESWPQRLAERIQAWAK